MKTSVFALLAVLLACSVEDAQAANTDRYKEKRERERYATMELNAGAMETMGGAMDSKAGKGSKTYAPTTYAPSTFPPTTYSPTVTEMPTPFTQIPTHYPTTYMPTFVPTYYSGKAGKPGGYDSKSAKGSKSGGYTTYAPTTYAPTTFPPTTYSPTITGMPTPFTQIPTHYPTTYMPTFVPTTFAPTYYYGKAGKTGGRVTPRHSNFLETMAATFQTHAEQQSAGGKARKLETKARKIEKPARKLGSKAMKR